MSICPAYFDESKIIETNLTVEACANSKMALASPANGRLPPYAYNFMSSIPAVVCTKWTRGSMPDAIKVEVFKWDVSENESIGAAYWTFKPNVKENEFSGRQYSPSTPIADGPDLIQWVGIPEYPSSNAKEFHLLFAVYATTLVPSTAYAVRVTANKDAEVMLCATVVIDNHGSLSTCPLRTVMTEDGCCGPTPTKSAGQYLDCGTGNCGREFFFNWGLPGDTIDQKCLESQAGVLDAQCYNNLCTPSVCPAYFDESKISQTNAFVEIIFPEGKEGLVSFDKDTYNLPPYAIGSLSSQGVPVCLSGTVNKHINTTGGCATLTVFMWDSKKNELGTPTGVKATFALYEPGRNGKSGGSKAPVMGPSNFNWMGLLEIGYKNFFNGPVHIYFQILSSYIDNITDAAYAVLVEMIDYDSEPLATFRVVMDNSRSTGCEKPYQVPSLEDGSCCVLKNYWGQHVSTNKPEFSSCGTPGCGRTHFPNVNPVMPCNTPNTCVQYGTPTAPYWSCECDPQCDTRNCGDNKCGGSCGTCQYPDSQVCTPGGKCCQPNCTNRICGPDGCGSSCGTCPTNKVCGPSGTCINPPEPCVRTATIRCAGLTVVEIVAVTVKVGRRVR